MSDFAIIEDTELMTFEKVAEFIDCLSISEMDKHELKSRVSDLEQDTYLRAYAQGFRKGDSDGRYFESHKVLDEVIKTLGNDYWNIAKIQGLKEQMNDTL